MVARMEIWKAFPMVVLWGYEMVYRMAVSTVDKSDVV